MLVETKSVFCVSRAAVLAAVLALGVLPAHADGFSVQSAADGPAVSLLSGVQACEPTFPDGLSEGSQCMAGWAVNHLLLDAATRFAVKQGEALFGEHFRIVSSMGFSPSGGALSGGLDVVLPLASSTLPGAAPSETGAFFLQQGVTRWVDDRGLGRTDFRSVPFAVLTCPTRPRRPVFLAFPPSSSRAANSTTRDSWPAATMPESGDGDRSTCSSYDGLAPARTGYEERALAGIELGSKFDLTTTLSITSAIGQWEEEDGLGGWSTNGRMAFGWQPHPWLDIGIAWNGLGTSSDSRAIRVGFSMPLGETRKPPQWEGLGLVGGGPEPSALDPWSPVEIWRYPSGTPRKRERPPRFRGHGSISSGQREQWRPDRHRGPPACRHFSRSGSGCDTRTRHWRQPGRPGSGLC